MPNIDFTKVCTPDQIKGDDEVETEELKKLFECAKSYISRFHWCNCIKQSYFGGGVDRIVGVFLFNIEPKLVGVDEWLWVIVGDLPPAHVVTDMSPDPAAALGSYIGEMRKWVDAVKKGKSTVGIIPVNVPPTREYANMLESRLNTLEQDFVPLFEEWKF